MAGNSKDSKILAYKDMIDVYKRQIIYVEINSNSYC